MLFKQPIRASFAARYASCGMAWICLRNMHVMTSCIARYAKASAAAGLEEKGRQCGDEDPEFLARYVHAMNRHLLECTIPASIFPKSEHLENLFWATVHAICTLPSTTSAHIHPSCPLALPHIFRNPSVLFKPANLLRVLHLHKITDSVLCHPPKGATSPVFLHCAS